MGHPQRSSTAGDYADDWRERDANERERLADDRGREADQRERLADDRERERPAWAGCGGQPMWRWTLVALDGPGSAAAIHGPGIDGSMMPSSSQV